MNTFGRLFRLTTFGESHGAAVGGIVDGMPAGVIVDTAYVQEMVARRRPGQSALTTARHEDDRVQFLSGIYEGRTTGAPIAFVIANSDAHSQDYAALAEVYRPSHADYTYQQKYGVRDPRGGGRASARGTVCRVVAGALAQLVLRQRGITVNAYTSQIGTIALTADYHSLSFATENAVRCPDAATAAAMEGLIREVRAAGDSVGGVVTGIIGGCPPGLGDPEAGKLHALLAAAMMSINAAKGFDYGSGFEGAKHRGSEENDPFILRDGAIHTATNHSGGIQGGISNGEDIVFRVAFKATPTIALPQQTVTTAGTATTLSATGRHDPCVVPRAVPVVEAMAALVVVDALLADNAYHL